jgi:hypothetical protein
MAKITQKGPEGAEEKVTRRRSVAELHAEALATSGALVEYVCQQVERPGSLPRFRDVEQEILSRIMALGRLLVALFLEAADRRQQDDGGAGRGAGSRDRWLLTRFGWVRYWRAYRKAVEKGRGFHPLDVALGLTADRVSFAMAGLAVRLATKLAFAEARDVLGWFTPTVPSTEVIERAVLGFGEHTGEWFRVAPAPDGDGQVLVVLADSKGAPTATESELARRRGPRRQRKATQSPRHRGRSQRNKYGSKPRRMKGDKSKHARMATLVVMYTLTRVGRNLLGPVNRWIYASFAPKKHAIAVARREADKRGFPVGCGKTIQVLTDGDPDLARYVAKAFPDAVHTIDVIHVVERLWTAGEAVYEEGSVELGEWVEARKAELYEGRIDALLTEMRRQLALRPKTGPGNKGRRERLAEVIGYIERRREKLNYGELRRKDLEIGTGAVEGAVKNMIGKRFDHGGMRWIRERAEALLQLRCIEANGDWERFLNWVHGKVQTSGKSSNANVRLFANRPGPLPTLTLDMTEEAPDAQSEAA